MGITYRRDTTLGVTVERWEGEITSDMICEHWRKLATDDLFLSGNKSLVLALDATPSFSPLELHTAIRKLHTPALAGKGRRVAICVKGQDRERLARAFALFSDPGQIVKLFDNKPGAIDWLLSDQE